MVKPRVDSPSKKGQRSPRSPVTKERSQPPAKVLSPAAVEVEDARRKVEELLVALEEERDYSARVKDELTVEVQTTAQQSQRLEEMTKLIAVSTSLAEKLEDERNEIANEKVKLQEDASALEEKLDELEEVKNELEVEVTQLRCELSNHKTESAKTQQEMKEEIVIQRKEKEQALFALDELKSELHANAKKYEAATELLKAQHTSHKNALEDHNDKLQAQISDLQTSLEDAVTQSEELRQQTKELRKELFEQGERFNARVAELEAAHTHSMEQCAKKIRSLRNNEGTLEHHIDVLLARATALQQTIEHQEGTIAKQRAEIDHQKELNHILAVKLKAAMADREASAMEAETRRILVAQNEEMERQLSDLRRTIAELMGTRR